MDNFYRKYNGIDIELVKATKTGRYTFTYLWLRFIVKAANEDAAYKAAYNFLLRERM